MKFSWHDSILRIEVVDWTTVLQCCGYCSMQIDIRRCWAVVIGLTVTLIAAARSHAEDDPVKLQNVKVAAVQILGYDKTDKPRAGYDPVAKMLPYIQRAGRDGAQMVVFPEYVLGRITVPGDQTERISAAASVSKIYVIVGCWEVFSDGRYANTSLIFDRSGKIAGKYRKTHAAVDTFEGEPAWSKPPQGKELNWFIRNDPEWKMERGDDLPVFDFDFGKIGILTCYDGWFPESFRVLSLKGAEILIWMNGRRGSVEDFIVKSTMFQSHVAIVATNQAYGGGTMIGDVPTRIVARCPNGQEAYITGTINLNRIRQVRKTSRNFQQRRPHLYQVLTQEPGNPSSRATDEVSKLD